MRVAVLITGQLRDYKVNYTNHMKHLILPNNADVFVYACTKNTIHSLGQSTSQKYNITSVQEPEILENEIREAYLFATSLSRFSTLFINTFVSISIDGKSR